MSTAPRHSIVQVNTGNGKGKTSAAIGVAVRGVARGWGVAVVQFLKSGEWLTGESIVSERLGIDFRSLGDGFTWATADIDKSAQCALEAWGVAAALIREGNHQLVILDEITYPLALRWLPTTEVVTAITTRPPHVNIVLTGRDAPPELIDVADTVTEMRNVKHAYERGITAMEGIDF